MNKKSKMKSVGLNSVLYTIIQIVTFISNILITKFLSSNLTLRDYGTYSTVNIIITIAASFTLFGLGDSLNYFFNSSKETENIDEKVSYLNSIFFIQLIIGAVIALLLIVFSEPISLYFSNNELPIYIIIISAKPWLTNCIHLLQLLTISTNKSHIITFKNLLLIVLKVIVVYLSIIVFNNLLIIFILLVLIDVIQLLVLFLITISQKINLNFFKFDVKKIKKIVLYALPMGVFFVTNTLMREIDKVMIGWFESTEVLAIYSNCGKVLPFNIIIVSFSAILLPYIMKSVSSGDYEESKKLIKNYSVLGYKTVWMFGVAVLICSTEAIRFLYSNEYLGGMNIFLIYIFDSMIQFANFHLIITANGDAKFLMKTSILLLILNILLNFILYFILSVVDLSILAPAIGTVIVSIILMILYLHKTKLILKAKLNDLLSLKKIGVYVVELIIIGAVMYFFKCMIKNFIYSDFLILLFVCGLYCVIISLLNIKDYINILKSFNDLKK